MAINITLDKKHKIQSDRHQFILVEDDRYIGFYPDLESLIKAYFKLKILTCEAKTIHGLLEYHKQCLNTLQQLLAPLEIEIVGKKSLLNPKELMEAEK